MTGPTSMTQDAIGRLREACERLIDNAFLTYAAVAPKEAVEQLQDDARKVRTLLAALDGDEEKVAWAINSAFNELSIGMPLTQEESFKLARAALKVIP